MDETRAASSTPPQNDGAGVFSGRKQEGSVMDSVKKGCTSFYASSQETLGYVKAFFVGWEKKITTKSEKEAAEAENMKKGT